MIPVVAAIFQPDVAMSENPILLVKQNGVVSPGSLEETSDRIPLTKESPLTSLLIPLVKSDRNANQGMITVGRATNNDIVFADANISKIHGWFLPPSRLYTQWRYVDAGSTNGSRLCGNPVTRPEVIHYGDILEFGQVHISFLHPDDVRELLTSVKRDYHIDDRWLDNSVKQTARR